MALARAARSVNTCVRIDSVVGKSATAPMPVKARTAMLARAGGPEAVVLREATRRVGVSATAAYRHFADHRALLHAVGLVAMSQLAREMEAQQQRARPRDDREAALLRLRGVGAGYLRYARTEPGLFRTAFAVTDEVGAEPDAEGGPTPFELLTQALDEAHADALSTTLLDVVEAGLLAAGRAG